MKKLRRVRADGPSNRWPLGRVHPCLRYHHASTLALATGPRWLPDLRRAEEAAPPRVKLGTRMTAATRAGFDDQIPGLTSSEVTGMSQQRRLSGYDRISLPHRLHEDAIRPWTHRSWLFPRDPDFERKAGRVLDLYACRWEGKPLQERTS
jgi:hypothetical protein